MRWDIFCKVIDNHGDIGVCWRLAADLAAPGRPACGSGSTMPAPWRGWRRTGSPAWRSCRGTRHARPNRATWSSRPSAASSTTPSSPPSPRKTQSGGRQPAWINLEYLSAEAWVERCHGLPSPVLSGPAQGLVKRFFYPGFTARTGGLLREPDLHGPAAPVRPRRLARVARHRVARRARGQPVLLRAARPAALVHAAGRER